MRQAIMLRTVGVSEYLNTEKRNPNIIVKFPNRKVYPT